MHLKYAYKIKQLEPQSTLGEKPTFQCLESSGKTWKVHGKIIFLHISKFWKDDISMNKKVSNVTFTRLSIVWKDELFLSFSEMER